MYVQSLVTVVKCARKLVLGSQIHLLVDQKTFGNVLYSLAFIVIISYNVNCTIDLSGMKTNDGL